MKYVSINRLSDFEFHDSKLVFVSFEDQCLVLKATHLNIHKGTEQNPHTSDMEIASARLTFEDFVIHSYEPGRAWKQDENGQVYTDEPKIVLSGNAAKSRFLTQVKNAMTVYDFGIKEETTYFIDGMAEDPFFTLLFTFRNIKIE